MSLTWGTFSLSISFWAVFASVALFILWRILRADKMKRRIRIGKTQSEGEHAIAVLDVQGPILDDTRGIPFFLRGRVCSGSQIRSVLEQLAEDDAVKGVIVRYNTPGGTMNGAESIRRGVALCKAKKPVYAHVGDVSASGGLWAMCSSTKTFARAGSLVGSIGVRMGTILSYQNVREVGDKFSYVAAEKVTATPLSAGRGKMFSDPFSPHDPEVLAHYQSMLTASYQQFCGIVARERKLEPAKVESLGALVFHTEDAIAHGLIDGCADEGEVVEKMAEELGVDKDDCAVMVVQMGGRLAALTGQVAEILHAGDVRQHMRLALSRVPILAMLHD
ncbi:MAG: S49 family peptidase [Patescibacteria group bacterium]